MSRRNISRCPNLQIALNDRSAPDYDKGLHQKAHHEEDGKEDGPKRSHSQERPRTVEFEDTESERRKKRRCDHSLGKEADLRIALARLDLLTDMPDTTMIENAYRQKMKDLEKEMDKEFDKD